jgi:YHS domain-containing protein
MKALAFITACLLMVSCGQQNKAEGENKKIEGQKPPMAKGGDKLAIDMSILASKIDPVCEMDISSGVADTATYKDKVYGFCGTGCKEEFVKKPADFIK